MSYFCPNCGGWQYSKQKGSEFDRATHQGRSSKKTGLNFYGLDAYKCHVCEKIYLIKVLKK